MDESKNESTRSRFLFQMSLDSDRTLTSLSLSEYAESKDETA